MRAFALVLLTSPLAAQVPEIQWARSTVSGHWHGFTPKTMTWAQAEQLAQAYGGHLTTIRSAAENAWFGATLGAIPGGSPVWIGLNDIAVEGTFVWTSGEAVTYTSWMPQQPDAFTPEHDVVDAASQGGPTAWANIPVGYAGNRPSIERTVIPESGWRLPKTTMLPFFNPGRPSRGDMNGDGLLDVVVPKRSIGPGKFAILHGLPGGGFAPAQEVPSEMDGFVSTVADFDNDGRLDVAIGTAMGLHAVVHFAGPALDYVQNWVTTFPLPVYDIAAGDVDGDGRADLLVARGMRLVLFRSAAGGVFQPPIEFPMGLPRGIVVADIDADGDLDWSVSEANLVRVFLNDGTGVAPVISTVPADPNAAAMAVADFDGDSHADLAVVSLGSVGVRVMWGDGAGAFDPTGPIVLAASWPFDLGTADFDGDGRPDLCVGDIGRSTVAVTLSGPGGVFSPQVDLFSGEVPRGTLTGDLDGDGRPEIFAATNPGEIRVQTRFATDCNHDGVDDTSEIRDDASLDLDGDGRLDACAIPGSAVCAGDGGGTPCPCGNDSLSGGDAGCLNSLGTAGRVVVNGLASISADVLVLHGSQMPSAPSLYFQGTMPLNGGFGVTFGDGLRCAGGTVVRLGTKLNVGGASQYPDAGDPSISVRGMVTSPGMRTYQVWYRNAAAFCTAATFNLTNGWLLTWTM